MNARRAPAIEAGWRLGKRHRPTAAELAQVLNREAHRTTTDTARLGESTARPPAGDDEHRTIPLAIGKPRRRLTSRPAMVGAAALCGLLALGYLLYPAAPNTTAAQAETTSTVPCSITYITSYTHDHHFDASMTVTSTASGSINKWTLQFWLSGGESIANTHPAIADTQQAADTPQFRVEQQGQQVTVTHPAASASGVPVSLMLKGRYGSAPTRPPIGFTLNGNRCDTAVTLRTIAQPADTTATTAKPPPRPPKSKNHTANDRTTIPPAEQSTRSTSPHSPLDPRASRIRQEGTKGSAPPRWASYCR